MILFKLALHGTIKQFDIGISKGCDRRMNRDCAAIRDRGRKHASGVGGGSSGGSGSQEDTATNGRHRDGPGLRLANVYYAILLVQPGACQPNIVSADSITEQLNQLTVDCFSSSSISKTSLGNRRKLAAPIMPLTCWTLRKPTIAPVTAGWFSVQAMATSPGARPCSFPIVRRCSTSLRLRDSSGS